MSDDDAEPGVMLLFHDDAGTGEAAIALTSTAGGITLTTGATTAVEGLTITASQTTKKAMVLTADGITTSKALEISVDALTTGKGIELKTTSNNLDGAKFLDVEADSSSTDAFTIARIKNTDTAAVSAIPLDLVNSANNAAGAGNQGPVMMRMTAGAGGDIFSLRSKSIVLQSPSGATTKDESNFIPAGAMPIAFVAKVTTQIPGTKFITKIGTAAVDDGFFGHLDNTAGVMDINDLQDADGTSVTSAPRAAIEPIFQANTDLRVTYDGNPASTAGRVRLTMYYYQLTAG